MKHLFTLLLLVITSLFALAQTPDFDWALQAQGKSSPFNSEAANDIARDHLGNSYVTGYFQSFITFGTTVLRNSGTSNCYYVAKYDPAGNVLWARQATTLDGEPSMGRGITTDGNGNCYVTGYYEWPTYFGTTLLNNLGFRDIFIAKYDTDGNLIWVKNAGGSTAQGKDIALDDSGNLFITGDFSGSATFGSTTFSASSTTKDIFLAKYDAAGNALWAKRAGNTSDDIGSGISTDAAGNCYVTGSFQGAVSFSGTTLSSSGSYDIFLVKYSGTGTVLWARKVGGSSSDNGNAVAVDAGGSVFIAGTFMGSALVGSTSFTSTGERDIVVAKYDTDGTVIWARKAGGTYSDFCNGVGVDNSGNCYITGTFYSMSALFGTTTLMNNASTVVYLARYDAAGTLSWARSADNPSEASCYGLAVDGNGNSWIAGMFEDSVAFPGHPIAAIREADLFAARFDATGNVLWATNAKGYSADDLGRSVATDASGNLYVTGYFTHQVTFGSITLTSNGGPDVFVAKYDPSGNVLWARQAGGTGTEHGKGIGVDASGNCYVTGYYNSSMSIGSITLSNYLSATENIFLAKYDAAGNVVWAVRAGGTGDDYSFALAADASGNSYITGYFSGSATFGSITLTSSGVRDVFIAKYDAAGNALWARKGGGTDHDYGQGIAVDGSGNCYVTGFYQSASVAFGSSTLSNSSAGTPDIFLVKYDAAGNNLWAYSSYGTGDERGHAVAVDGSGNCYLTGYFKSASLYFGPTSATLTNSGLQDVFIAKFTTNGSVIWTQQAGGANADIAYGITTDASGNSYVTGNFEGTAQFSGTSLNSSGNTDIFLARYDPSGTLSWVKQAGGPELDNSFDVAVDGNGKSYFTGYFTQNATFGSHALSSPGSEMFLARLGAPVSNTLHTGPLASSAYCQRALLTIPFTAMGSFAAGNTFTAQLSDASGAFGTPVSIGSISSTSSGNIPALIPAGQATGAAYRIRVVASSPAVTGTDNGSNFSINALPATITATGASRCGPGSVTLQASGVPAGGSYRWYAAATGGTSISGATSATYTTPSLAATTTYYVTAVSAAGCESASRTSVQAVINPVPAAPVAGGSPVAVYLGSTTTLSISNPVHGLTYTWAGDGLSAATGTSVTALPNNTGTETYTVTAANAMGCISAVFTISVQVNSPLLTSAINGTTFCAGLSLPVSYTFVNNPVFTTVNVFTAQLSDASGSFAAPVVIGTKTGTTAGTITAKLPATAVGTGYRIRVISSSPAYVGSNNGSDLAILAAPTPLTTTNVYYCNGQTGSGTLTVSGGGASVTGYNWYTVSTGGTAFHTGTSYTTPVLTSSKAYYVAAVNSNGCESIPRKAAAVYITPSFTVSVSPASATFPLGGNTVLTASSDLAGVTFKWSPATGLSSASGATVTASPAATTTYTVTGTRNTCTVTTTVTVTVTCPGPLAGSYTINKTAAASQSNFTSFRSFAERINLCGVSAPVTVNVAAGTGPYTEQVEFGQISGVSATNTVTLNGNGNVLQFAPVSTANYVLRLNGTDYFRLQGMVLTSTSATIGWGVHLFNGAEHTMISNCTINLNAASTATALNGIVASASATAANTAGLTVTNLQLLNNTVNGGYYGISICSEVTAKAAGIVISGNTINSSYFAGIYGFNLNAAQLSGNTIAIRTGNINSYGLFLNSVENGFGVQKNKVTGFGRYGLNLTNCNSTAVATRAQVSNNMIGGGVQNSTAATYGLYLNNADRVDVWHNSVNLDQGFTNSGAFYALASSAALDVRNNSFAFSGTSASYAFWAGSASLTTLDYNNYYSTGTKFAYLSADKADLTALQAVIAPTGHDQNSYQGNPMYVSATNLHVQAASTQLGNRGIAISGMTSDIDGNARATSPDLGADEYYAPARMMAAASGTLFQVSAYPNPFTSELNIKVECDSTDPLLLTLTDILGRVVEQRTVSTGNHNISTSELKTGLYLLILRQGENIQQIKVAKEQ